MNGAILGLTPREIDRRYPRIVEFADIGPFIDQPIKTYSTGMVVRLAFAVVAHVDADVLIIDEALAVGDAFFVQKCMRFLREFMKTGTILFVSHDTGAVVNLCHRAIWLHQGEMLMDGPARDVTEAYLANIAEEAYGAGTRRQRPSAPGQMAQNRAHGTPAPTDHVSPAPASGADGVQASVMAISPVDFQGRSFGKGGARIVEAVLLNEADESIGAISGGELVTMQIRCEAVDRLESPIVGFILKDRLGQVLFSDNTFVRTPTGRSPPTLAASSRRVSPSSCRSWPSASTPSGSPSPRARK